MGLCRQVKVFVKKTSIPYSRISVNKETQADETITFLGTGGARFMIISQLLASGGIWFNLNGTQFLMDPGPGSIVQVTKRKLNPDKLSGIIVSHRHLDHAADVNVITEAMTGGGFNKRGGPVLVCPGLGRNGRIGKGLSSMPSVGQGTRKPTDCKV